MVLFCKVKARQFKMRNSKKNPLKGKEINILVFMFYEGLTTPGVLVKM